MLVSDLNQGGDVRAKPVGVLVLFFGVALACACSWAGEEFGTVVRVIDGDSLEVELPDRVEKVRLLGVDTPEMGRKELVVEYFAVEAAAFTRKLAQGKRVKLETDPKGDTRDRYDRALRYVYLPDGRMLNAAIISEGYGHAYTRFPFSKLEEFRKLEREARDAGRGLWNADALPTLTAAEAADHIGSTATVCGTVASTKFAERSNAQPTYLNLDRPYPDQLLTVVIWGTDRGSFGEPEKRYSGKRICVTGKVELFRERPQIIARDPSQVTVD
jgi:endonuclease YncB( thermonuclease family)